jgi:hypothetical protein
MSSYAKIGSFQNPASTGSQSVTGVGFQPKAVIIWGANTAASPPEITDFNYWSFGWTDGTNHVAMTSLGLDNVVATVNNRAISTSAIIIAHDSSNTVQHRATFTSFNADGFTINWSNIFGSQQRYWVYLAIGGTDISIKSGSFTINTSTGDQAITGVGFLPTGYFLTTDAFTTTPTNGGTNIIVSGWADGTRQAVSTVRSDNAANPANTYRYQRTSKISAVLNTGGTTVFDASAVSLDSDGFTININPAPATAYIHYYLAFRGMTAYAGTFTEQASTGTQAVTGVGFAPGCVLFQQVGAAASSSINNDSKFGLGGMSRSAQRSVWVGDLDNASAVTARRYSQTEVISVYTPTATGTSSTPLAIAAYSSLDSDGFTVNWTTNDGTSREILFFALSAGEAPSSSFNALLIAP